MLSERLGIPVKELILLRPRKRYIKIEYEDEEERQERTENVQG